jgi:arabinofuranan 3-O-arabinosyltransferase
MSRVIASDDCVAPEATPSHGPVTSPDGSIGHWRRIQAHSAYRPLAVAFTAAVWIAAAAAWTTLCLRVSRYNPASLGWDFVTSWHAAAAFAHGGQPYTRSQTAGRLFLYPPSSLLLMRPIAAFSLHQLQMFGLAVSAIIAWGATMASVGLVGRRWYGPTAALAVLILRYTKPMIAELGLQNVTILCLLALVLFYWLASKGRWTLAAIPIGLSLSVKPLLIVVLLVFVLARKWVGLAVSLAIPAVLNLVAFLVVADPGEVFSKLPSLLNRSDSGVRLNSAWVDSLRPFATPDGGVIAIRLLTAAIAVAAAAMAWRRLTDRTVRIITTSSVLLLGAYLAGTLSENHFMLTLVPLAVTVVVPGAPMRWFPAWLGMALLMGLIPAHSFLHYGGAENQSVAMAFGMTIVLLTIVAALAWGGRHPASQASRAMVLS